jgi:hypothetical protein
MLTNNASLIAAARSAAADPRDANLRSFGGRMRAQCSNKRAMPTRPVAPERDAVLELLRCRGRMPLRLRHNVEVPGGQ